MADIQWIKLMVGMFDGYSFKRIKRAKIGGVSYRDKLTAVWFELLDLAGKSNANGYLIQDEIPYRSFEDIATMLDRDEKEIELCMQYFINERMIEIIDDVYCLANFMKYQNHDGLEKIREQNRLRQAKYKQRQKLLASNVSGNVIVTEGNGTDIDIEEEKELEKDNKNKKNYIYTVVIDYLNKKVGTRYRANNKTTQKHINARLTEGYTYDDFKIVIDKMCAKWKDTDMEQYLRPETLFGTKFESYLNAKINTEEEEKNEPTGKFDSSSKFDEFIPNDTYI